MIKCAQIVKYGEADNLQMIIMSLIVIMYYFKEESEGMDIVTKIVLYRKATI